MLSGLMSPSSGTFRIRNVCFLTPRRVICQARTWFVCLLVIVLSSGTSWKCSGTIGGARQDPYISIFPLFTQTDTQRESMVDAVMLARQ